MVDDVLARRLPPGRRDTVGVRAEAGVRWLLLRLCQLQDAACSASYNCAQADICRYNASRGLALSPSYASVTGSPGS